MRVIGGMLKSTPLKWLLVISNILPPKSQREQFLIRKWTKCINNPNLPMQTDLRSFNVRPGLKSRKPPSLTTKELIRHNLHSYIKWQQEWESDNPDIQTIRSNPIIKLPSFDLPRNIWVTLNCLQTRHGRCKYLLYKWKLEKSPACDCGCVSQTIPHIITECPLHAFNGTIEQGRI